MDYDDLLDFERSSRYDERQKAALLYTSAIVWNPDGADEPLWERLRLHFSEEELVELGYFIAVTYGQQRWIKTLGIADGEPLDLTKAGLAPPEAR
jgi:alkylhydroperoxidase family enzyme